MQTSVLPLRQWKPAFLFAPSPTPDLSGARTSFFGRGRSYIPVPTETLHHTPDSKSQTSASHKLWPFSDRRPIPLIMNTLIKLLPRLRRREQGRSPPSTVVKRPMKRPQNIILEGVLDISKEARDAIAAQEREAWLAFEIAFPPQSPTESGGSCGPSGKIQEGFFQTSTSPSASPLPPSPLPVSGGNPATAPAPLRDVLASDLSRRRNFKGRPLVTSLPFPIPPMPTTPPPRPQTSCSDSSSARSLRRQPRYTDLNTAFPIRRCRTFPLSKDLTARSTRASAPLSGSAAEGGADARSAVEQRSTTPAGTPTNLAFPMPPRATFTKRAPARNSATRDMFTIEESAAGVEPLCIVKRVSGAVATESAPSSPFVVDTVMDALFSSLDDVYAEFHDAEALSLVSIPLSGSESESGDDDEEIPDLDGETAWRSRYAGAFGLDTLPPASGERQTWPCPYSFLAGRSHALDRYSAQGSRSLPELALEA
ncbi:hypothetical protein FB451DRAFT_321903 [Mycena latifolia]|nr:hypothetical protein FB451DRAFT_321903 [Mycena latifolia]